MPNLTLTLPAEQIREARIAAARRGSSVSALVGELLSAVTSSGSYEDKWVAEEAKMHRGLVSVGSGWLSRDEAHRR